MFTEALFFITNFVLLYVAVRKLDPRLREKKAVKAVMYLNSIAHGILIFASSYSFLTRKMPMEKYFTYIEMTKGYLLYDLITICYFRKHMDGFIMMLFHHIIFLSSLVFSDFLSIYTDLLAQALTCEITNFFLYGGWFLIQLGLEKTFLFVMNALILVTLFLYFRVFNFIHLFITSLNVPGADFESLILFFVALLNSYWFILLAKKFINTLIYL